MSIRIDRTRIRLFAAVGVVVLLGATLGARLLALEVEAPRAAVPPPGPFDAAELEVPCWSCPVSKSWSIRFRTDLDLLAPLGDGPGNAAEYFAAFRRPDGARQAEAATASKQLIDNPITGGHLPFDHPLVLEAEPWVDQGTMRFYPEVLEPRGYETQIPNLLYMLSLARTWAARGLAADDIEAALADFRRAIRLGRLLRQEDAVVITDLVGLACIHIGARTMYDWARERGDTDLALLASIVLGEVAPQRLRTMMDVSWPEDSVESVDPLRVHLSDREVDEILENADEYPDRRFRLEAIGALGLVYHRGTDGQRARAGVALDELVRSEDPMTRAMALWARDQPYDMSMLRPAAQR